MEEEWNELYRNAPLATPFQSWAWLYSWWEFYGEDCQLRIIAVRDGHLLVGLAPLMLQRRWGFGRLLFVGGCEIDITDYLDILVTARGGRIGSRRQRTGLFGRWAPGMWRTSESCAQQQPPGTSFGVGTDLEHTLERPAV